jgi:hypothetical protein
MPGFAVHNAALKPEGYTPSPKIKAQGLKQERELIGHPMSGLAVKMRNTRTEQMSSAVDPTTDMGRAGIGDDKTLN